MSRATPNRHPKRRTEYSPRTQSAGIEKPGEGESRVAGVETAEKIIAKIDECTKVQKN